MHIRAGKYGDDKIFIIYAETKSGGFGLDYLDRGIIPKLEIINVSTLQKIKQDKTFDKLIMNTNEDLRTFYDGVLIWATANKNGKLVVYKIGTPRLNENNDDIDYILTKDDLIKEEKNNSNSFSIVQIVIIAIGIILGILLLIFLIYMLIRCFKSKEISNEVNSLDNEKLVA